MKKLLVSLGLLALVHGPLWSEPASRVTSLEDHRIIQDTSTKVVYYIESDRRHVAAISADGKLLWCAEVLPVPKNDSEKPDQIDWIANRDKGFLLVAVHVGLGTSATIDKATGSVKFSGHVP